MLAVQHMYFLMIMTVMMKMTTRVGIVNEMTAGFQENNVRVEHVMLRPNPDSVIQWIFLCPHFYCKCYFIFKKSLSLKSGLHKCFMTKATAPFRLSNYSICNFSLNVKGDQTKVPNIENVIFRSSEHTSEKGLWCLLNQTKSVSETQQ